MRATCCRNSRPQSSLLRFCANLFEVRIVRIGVKWRQRFRSLSRAQSVSTHHLANLTADKTGGPEGGKFEPSVQIIRGGIDLDHLYPTCTGTA
jgi:hypothetical protein